jgi:CheY-like chemotaxis protein
MEFRVHHHHPVAFRQGQEIVIIHGLFLQPVAQPEAQRQVEQRQRQQGDEPIRAPQPDEFNGRVQEIKDGLAVEAESCSEGPAAVEKVIQQTFQIVIIDWDMQPEAGLLLTTARERKAAERPLTLAIVSVDTSVPKALQAGANSILRKPILLNQVQDTLKTACDLLRARESAAQAAAASAASSARPACLEQGSENPLRAGEFLQSSQPAPGAQFLVE